MLSTNARTSSFRRGGEWSALSADRPRLIEALTGIDPLPRVQLFELIRDEVVALARQSPLVLCLEDVHWSDRATRDVARYLFAAAREGRWGLLCTFRPGEADRAPAVDAWLDRLRQDLVLEVRLEPLSVDGVREQIAHITGEDPDPGVAAALHRRSGGVPLLVEELLAARRSGWPGVPERVRDLMTARVRRLGKTATALVELVAVADGCDERTLTAASGLDRATVSEALDGATAAEVLRTDGRRYALRHDLLADAIIEALPAGRRRALHASLARAIAQTWPADVAAQAVHWHEADEPAAAVRAGLAAAELAERVHAPAEAHRSLERVLSDLAVLSPSPADTEVAPSDAASEYLQHPGRRRVLLARAAEDAYLGGAFARAAELALEATVQPGTEPEDALVWERLARYRFVAGEGSGAADAYFRALSAVSDNTAAATRARVWAAYSWNGTITGGAPDALAWARRALAAAADGDPLARCRALLALGLAEGELSASTAAFEEALVLASEEDAADEVGRALVGLALALRGSGDRARLEDVLGDLIRRSQAYGMEHAYGAVGHYLRGELLIRAGRWDEAAAALDEGLREGAHGVPELFLRAHRARLAARRGRWDIVAEDAALVRERSALLPQQTLPLALALCAEAEASLWRRKPSDALDRGNAARELAGDPIARAEADVLSARAEADVAEAVRLRPGEASATARATPAAVAAAARSPSGSAAAVSPCEVPAEATARALVAAEASRRAGDRDAGPWRVALTAADAVADPYLAGYACWRLAQILVAGRSGRREAALVVRRARDVATELGANPLKFAVEAFARSARITLSTQSPTNDGAVGLAPTPREREVLERMAAGRMNAQIADALGISPRTVGVHVSALLRKLGAVRRTEAVDLARRRGLLDS